MPLTLASAVDLWARIRGGDFTVRFLVNSVVARCLPLALLGAVAGCSAQNEFKPPPPPKVTVAQPVQRPVEDYVEFTGTTQATSSVDLRARVNGYLREINFRDGAQVKEGDLLFVIEQRPFRIALQAAEAQLQKAEANLQLKQASYRRIVELIQRKAASQQELDVQKAELASAQADVAAAQAAIEQARQNLDYTEVRAPLTGHIGRHLVDVGNLVAAEQTLLARIESIDPIHAYFYISDNDMTRFNELRRSEKIPETQPPTELQLYVGNESQQAYPHAGRLDFQELGVDPTTGTVLRRGVFPNPNQELVPGMFVRVRRATGDPSPKLLVEARALGADQRGDYLLVVNDKNVVEYRPVQLGQEVGAMRVIEQGVQPGEWVVVNGLQRARPGAPVDPEKAEMAAPEVDLTQQTAAK
jgi:RND family efflux transporter MFP subunit